MSQSQLSADWKGTPYASTIRIALRPLLAIFMSGLYSCLTAGLFNETVADLTQQYLSVQFNAVRELANYTTSGISEEVYGPGWVAPPIHLQQYLAFGQLAAAELFTTTLGIGPGPGDDSYVLPNNIRVIPVSSGPEVAAVLPPRLRRQHLLRRPRGRPTSVPSWAVSWEA